MPPYFPPSPFPQIQGPQGSLNSISPWSRHDQSALMFQAQQDPLLGWNQPWAMHPATFPQHPWEMIRKPMTTGLDQSEQKKCTPKGTAGTERKDKRSFTFVLCRGRFLGERGDG